VHGAEIDLVQAGAETLARTRYFYTEYHDHELYEGQVILGKLLGLLPGFESIRRYPCDIPLGMPHSEVKHD
jgi:hypothetical protein